MEAALGNKKRCAFEKPTSNPLFMNMKKTSLAALLTISAALATTAHADGWVGYMNWFDHIDGVPGETPAGGSVFELGLLRSTVLVSNVGTHIGDQLYLEPNYSTYDPDDPYWSDGEGNGNKFMEGNTYVEQPSLSIPTANFAGVVDEYDLDADYEAIAFIKILNPDAGWSMDAFESTPLSLGGSFDLDLDLTPHQGKILQYGFAVLGMNANSAQGDLGGVSVTVIPEPSTYALVLAGATGLLLAFRRRKAA